MSNDELDEQDYGVNTTTFIWDVSDLSDPQLIGTFVSETSAIDYNMYVLDTLVPVQLPRGVARARLDQH